MEASSSPRRPKIIWVILIFYVIGTLWFFLGLGLVYSGRVPLSAAQQTYFANLTIFDHIGTAVLATINIVAAILLFRLRATAVILFAAALALDLALTVRSILYSNWLDAFRGGGSIGYIVGLMIPVAVLMYAIKLKRRAILS